MATSHFYHSVLRLSALRPIRWSQQLLFGSSLASGLAWPGPQEGLGQGWPRLKWAKGRFGSKNDEKVKVLRMEFSIVENLSGLQESIFNLSRGPQLHFGEKSKNWSNFIKFTDFPPLPLFVVPWAAVILYRVNRKFRLAWIW